MKKAKHVNKLIFLIVLVTVAFLSMGASSWLIISENSANPAWTEPGEAPTLSGLNAVTMYEGDTPVFNAAVFTIARTWKQPRCPLTDELIKKCGTYTQWNSQFSSVQ